MALDLFHTEQHIVWNINNTRSFFVTLYQHMLVFYGFMALVSAIITFFLAKDRLSIKLLSAVLVGATWPMSFPVALLFALF